MDTCTITDPSSFPMHLLIVVYFKGVNASTFIVDETGRCSFLSLLGLRCVIYNGARSFVVLKVNKDVMD